MCLRFVYGWNSEETLEKTIYIYIYLFRGFNDARAQYLKINQVSLQMIEISKVWPFMHGILSFHEYMHPRYIYIYQYFPSRGKYERWNKDPSSKQSSSTESIFQNHFHYSRVSLAVWDSNSFWKKKNVLVLEKKCPFSSQCVVVALNRKRVKKEKRRRRKMERINFESHAGMEFDTVKNWYNCATIARMSRTF